MTEAPEVEGVPEPGTVLLNKYRVERVLGHGGMGVVVSAWHAALEQRVALKFLVGDASRQREAVERFLREARAAVKLHSEHVAKVTDVGTLESGSPYMVMEFLDGRDLGDVIDDGEPLPLATIVDYVLQTIDAVAEAHSRGIVHRDLKPSNLFLTRREDGGQIIKVLDFGISKSDSLSESMDKMALTRTSTVMGSPLYMSPEQFRSSKKVDWRTDIWALGVILYELLSHVTPFSGETVGEVFEAVLQTEPISVRESRPDVPPELEEVILRCLRKRPEERFADAAELAQALAPFGSGDSERCVSRARRLLAGKSLSRLMTDGPPSSNNAMVVGSSGKKGEKGMVSLPPVRRTSGGWGTSDSSASPRRSRLQLLTGLGAAAVLFVGGVTVVKVIDKTGEEHAASTALVAAETRAEEKRPALALANPANPAPAPAPANSVAAHPGASAAPAASVANADAGTPPRAPHKAAPKVPVKAAVPTPNASVNANANGSGPNPAEGILDDRH